MDNDTITIIVFLSLLLLLIIFIIVFRAKIFLRKREDDFGVYETPTITSCKTSTGFCTDKGFNYSISKCIPNSTTKKGCLNSKGVQTFETIIKKKSCIPQCISSLWNINSVSQCIPDIVKPTPFGNCTPSGISGLKNVNQTCIANDTGGINSCTVILKPNEVLPSWTSLCVLNNTKTLATCPVGTNITLSETCIPNPSIYKTCGEWGIDGGKEICTRSEVISRSNLCYSLTETTGTGGRVLLSKITDTYNFGWTSSFPEGNDVTPLYKLMSCVKFISSDGNVISTPDIACPYPTGVVSNILNFKTALLGGNGVVSNINDYTFPQVECIQPCSFYDPVAIVNGPSRFQTWMKNIIMYPFFIKNVSGTRYMTINNIPCSGNPADSLTQGTIIKYEPFSDCYGNPDNQLDISNAKLYEPTKLANNNAAYGINGYYTNNKTTFNTCNIQDIKLSNNTIFLFNPIESVDMYLNSTTTRKVLKGVLVGIQNKDYIGTVVRNSAGDFEWRQINSDNFTYIENIVNIVYLDFVTTNLYRFYSSVPLTPVFTPPVKINTQYMENASTESDYNIEFLPPNFNINYVDGNRYTSPDLQLNNPIPGYQGSLNFTGFNNYLIYRQSRLNPYSCSAFYSYPPPKDYPNPDTSQFIGYDIRSQIYGNCGTISNDPDCNNGNQTGL